MIIKKKKIFKNIIFLIGLPGSGKTSIAKRLKKILQKENFITIHIDGDEIRKILKNKQYTDKERIKLSLTYINLAELLIKDVDIVIISSVSLNNKIEKYYKNKNYIKTFLINKKFKSINYSKDHIRKTYIKKTNYQIPSNIDKEIDNFKISTSVNSILSYFD